MNVLLTRQRIFFSPELIKTAKLEKGAYIFMFKIKGENTFGFHKADREQAKHIICTEVKARKIDGKLYCEPYETPVGFIKASMRLSFKQRKTIQVVLQKNGEADLFLLKND
jgi:hypothetical protein